MHTSAATHTHAHAQAHAPSRAYEHTGTLVSKSVCTSPGTQALLCTLAQCIALRARHEHDMAMLNVIPTSKGPCHCPLSHFAHVHGIANTIDPHPSTSLHNPPQPFTNTHVPAIVASCGGLLGGWRDLEGCEGCGGLWRTALEAQALNLAAHCARAALPAARLCSTKDQSD